MSFTEAYGRSICTILEGVSVNRNGGKCISKPSDGKEIHEALIDSGASAISSDLVGIR